MPKSSFNIPPSTTNPSGEERTVGYEFEFTGVEMPEAGGIIQSLYGGKLREISTYEYAVEESRFGTFKLELDAQLFREKKYEKVLKSVGVDLASFKNIDSIEDALKDLASSVVPFEIITPPMPLSDMDELNLLVDRLREMKAKGTGSSFIYAFGMHINPEAPELSAGSILNHLRAYVLLDPWIRKDAAINMSRKITPYINSFEEDYIDHILQPDYQPGMDQLIRDYIGFGNSRNRALDLLPLFMHIDDILTSSLIEETLTRSRPTYHYRLPNCSLEDPEWSIASEWNRWVFVETMAADKKMLDRYSRARLRLKRESMVRFEHKWLQLMTRWAHEIH
ncbi:amidoligase family protein [Rhodohalobacter mucosus]|uniref:Amidoligase n=1 Tax=Rhodohalobacter mucosus TaxID=2079485 RepID=A0A316TXZ3_9BACT|nr:amidoligase family protein [Rhodohalobacter mucosus]PWN08255.1 amidoligase [Rhodohalobacter mucosus]